MSKSMEYTYGELVLVGFVLWVGKNSSANFGHLIGLIFL